jgi:hypothetical protein
MPLIDPICPGKVAIFAQRKLGSILVFSDTIFSFREQTSWNFRAGAIVSRKKQVKHERKR